MTARGSFIGEGSVTAVHGAQKTTHAAEIACPLRYWSTGSKYIWGEALPSIQIISLRSRVQYLKSANTYIETQFEIETINAVPTPLLDVGEKAFAAQLLHVE